MKNIPEYHGEERISLCDFQFYAKAKFLRSHLNRLARAYRHHVVQQSDVVFVIQDPDKFSSESGAFLSLSSKSKVVRKYFVFSAIVGNVTPNTAWIIRIELVRKDKHFSCTGGRTVWLMLDESCRRMASLHNSAEVLVGSGECACSILTSKLTEQRGIPHPVKEEWIPFLG